MANEQVRVDLTANDKASRTIDDVADSAEKLERLDPELDVSADDRATPTLDKVTDAAEALDKLSPEVQVGADTDAARRGIGDVAGDAEALTRADHELVLKARVDAARADLKVFRDDLDQTADKAVDVDRQLDRIGRNTGPGLAGNSVADLTGPLGDASSKASDIAGVFDGLGDIAGNAAARVGLSAESMAGAITGIGFAVTAAAAAWAYFRQRQEAARQKQEELVKNQRDLNKAIADGDRLAAASKFDEMYGDALRAAEGFGVSVDEVTRFISGQSAEIPSLNKALADAQTQYDRSASSARGAAGEAASNLVAMKGLRDELVGARGDYDRANGSIAEQDRRLSSVGRALGVASDATDDFATSQDRVEESTRRVNAALDRMRGNLDVDQAMNDFKRAVIDGMNEVGESALDQSDDVLALKQSVIDMGEQFKKSPVEIQTVLDAVDAGDLQSVAKSVEDWYRMNPIILASKLDRPGQITGGLTGTSGGPSRQSIDVPTIGVLNMTLPAGWRGDPVRAAHVQRRRSGRYYARA